MTTTATPPTQPTQSVRPTLVTYLLLMALVLVPLLALLSPYLVSLATGAILAALWDRHVGFDLPRDLATRLPQSTLEIFDRSAHSIHDEEPTKYVESIRKFLGR